MEEEKTTILEPAERPDTQEIAPVKKTKPGIPKDMPMYIIIGVLVVALLVMAYFCFFKAKERLAVKAQPKFARCKK